MAALAVVLSLSGALSANPLEEGWNHWGVEAPAPLQAPAPLFSSEELKAQGLWPEPAPKRESQATTAPKRNAYGMGALYVKVSQVVYERVAVDPNLAHRRRSLASRGAKAGATQTVARRKIVDLDLTPIICKYAERFNLDPWLVRAVIETESNFYPYAGSPAGASGLMQLMPATAASLGCRDPFDPESNIRAGARYLRQMLNLFDGNYQLAIAAYNAGPGNVQRYGGIPHFSETRHYVRQVTSLWKKRKAQAQKG